MMMVVTVMMMTVMILVVVIMITLMTMLDELKSLQSGIVIDHNSESRLPIVQINVILSFFLRLSSTVVLNLFQYMHPFQISSQFSHPLIAEIQKNAKIQS